LQKTPGFSDDLPILVLKNLGTLGSDEVMRKPEEFPFLWPLKGRTSRFGLTFDSVAATKFPDSKKKTLQTTGRNKK
jgi:hypothetical protein